MHSMGTLCNRTPTGADGRRLLRLPSSPDELPLVLVESDDTEIDRPTAERRRAAVMGDPAGPYWNRRDPRHRNAVEDVLMLTAALTGDDSMLDEAGIRGDEQRAIDDAMADPDGPYLNRLHPGHRAEVERVTRLFEAIEQKKGGQPQTSTQARPEAPGRGPNPDRPDDIGTPNGVRIGEDSEADAVKSRVAQSPPARPDTTRPSASPGAASADRPTPDQARPETADAVRPIQGWHAGFKPVLFDALALSEHETWEAERDAAAARAGSADIASASMLRRARALALLADEVIAERARPPERRAGRHGIPVEPLAGAPQGDANRQGRLSRATMDALKPLLLGTATVDGEATSLDPSFHRAEVARADRMGGRLAAALRSEPLLARASAAFDAMAPDERRAAIARVGAIIAAESGLAPPDLAFVARTEGRMTTRAHVNAPAVKDGRLVLDRTVHLNADLLEGRSAVPDAFKELVADLAHEISGHLVQFAAIESRSGKPSAAAAPGDPRPAPSVPHAQALMFLANLAAYAQSGDETDPTLYPRQPLEKHAFIFKERVEAALGIRRSSEPERGR